MSGLSSVVYWIRYFLTARPIPFGGLDVQLHSVALAGWAGLLVTALNLVPVGTLDGGHVVFLLYEMITRRAPNQRVLEVAQMVGMVLLLSLIVFANGNDLFKAIFNG